MCPRLPGPLRFARARAHVHALMTQNSCPVGMRNAILRNTKNLLKTCAMLRVQNCCWQEPITLLLERASLKLSYIARAQLNCCRYTNEDILNLRMTQFTLDSLFLCSCVGFTDVIRVRINNHMTVSVMNQRQTIDYCRLFIAYRKFDLNK